MKILTYCSIGLLLALIAFPITAEAFSRRTHSSEVAQRQVPAPRDGNTQKHDGNTQKHDGNTQTQDVSPQAVPEPPALLLMGIGIGLFAIFSMIKRFRGQAASRDKAM
jgi:PEP-CTERM motif